MSVYINFIIQRRNSKEGTWVNVGDGVSTDNILVSVFDPHGIHNYETTEKGFPEDSDTIRCGKDAYNKTYYSFAEIENFVLTAENNVKKRLDFINNSNYFNLFKGLVRDKEFDEIEFNLISINKDSDDNYAIDEFVALQRLFGSMEYVRNMLSYDTERHNTRLIVFYN